MEWPVIIRRVVAIEPVLDHLVDEPAVDPFVEVRRLHSEEEKPEDRGQPDDQPRGPIHFPGPHQELVHPRPDRRRNQWRGLRDAASTRSDAHIGNRWLWLHREQFYSVYFATLQAGVGE